MSDQEFILAPPTVKVRFAVEPVRNQLNNLSLLNQVQDLSGFGEWVSNTFEAMTAEGRRNNQIVLSFLLDWDEFSAQADFEAGIALMRSKTPELFLQNILSHITDKAEHMGLEVQVDEARLIADRAYYTHLIESTIGKHYADKGKTLDISLYEHIHELFATPEKLRDLVVDHLSYMWETFLKADWERNLPLLNESAMAFRQMDFRGQTSIDTIRAVTGRDLTGYFDGLESANNITFIPSAHIGPYVIFHHAVGPQKINYLIFGARVPEGATRSQDLGRSELLVRLNALADDTRLKILELMTQHDEVCAQDIITWLDLSQSSASRHLRQLTATGYINERRREVAKCYTLNRERVDDTLFALKRFLKM